MRLAIDDFGTGYSSLSYLHRFPVDDAQDRPLVHRRRSRERRSRRSFSRSCGWADDFSLRPVAEGIETEEHLDHLRNTGCDLVQGHFFAAPLSEQQVRKGLQKGTFTWPAKTAV